MRKRVIPDSARQIKAGRALLKWSQWDLSCKSRVSNSTIADFESGKRTPRDDNIMKMREALEAAGVEFINTPTEFGVRDKFWEIRNQRS